MAPVLKSVLAAFTLIEVLIVLLIVSIVMGMAALNLHATGRAVACQQVEHVATLLSRLNQSAILQQHTYAISILPQLVRVSMLNKTLFAGAYTERPELVTDEAFLVPEWSSFHFQVSAMPEENQALFFKDGTVTPYTWTFFSQDTGRVRLSISTIAQIHITGGCAAYE